MNNETEKQKSPRELIREKLNETSLSEAAKEELGKKAEVIYQQLKSDANSFRTVHNEKLVDIANLLACDATYCAIPKQLPKTPAGLRKKARNITGIQPVIDPLARTDKTLKLLRNIFYEGKSFYDNEEDSSVLISGADIGDIVEKKSKEIIAAYLKKYSETGKTVPSGSATTLGAAYYTSSILVGYDLTQRDVAYTLGITELTIRNRFKEIVELLGIEIPKTSGYWKHSHKLKNIH